ncbi:MAG TPA: hypothetical protein VM925_00605 [Labilithrix sp.]|nr:hypothetical protein [Labilithrix sp.]
MSAHKLSTAVVVALVLLVPAGCSRAREAPASAVLPADPHADGAVIAVPVDGSAPPIIDASSGCEEAPALFLFTSPAVPSAGRPLRVLAVSDKPLEGELRVEPAAGSRPPMRDGERRGGPPYFWTVEVSAPTAGPWTATFARSACAGDRAPTALKIDVRKTAPPAPAPPKDGLWPARAAWTHAFENVYSAWIETLFDAPEGEQPSWPALHEVLRDPKRNLLFDHLGSREDSSKDAPVIRPDCADLPYFLRAYFAWKLQLPFGLAECNRGGGGAPPSCSGLVTNEDADGRAEARKKDGAVATFGAFLRGTLADRAHSGSARTPFEDESSDYYPVKLTWESLRPGTVYADPYGHILVVAKRLPQTAERGGMLYAVDGQPDGTVARKRFWRGNFLYATQRELGGPGFKHFRPVARRATKLVRLADAEINASREYGDLSREASALDVEGFYDAMDDVLAPRPLDPERALMETIGALEEQVRTRVQSVDNGRKWLEKAPPPAAMPDGAEIFETTGAWEDFSTPSRDLRLLIAIDVVRGFPARVARRPERYSMPPGKSAKDVEVELGKKLERELVSRTVRYTRSDGSSTELTLAEVLARSAAFEMTYNPNDCVETRWGAPPGTDETSTCRAHAPADQKARMETYRAWFRDRRRPPRK